MTFGKRYWSDGIIVAGQQFEHSEDGTGNPKFAGSGGDEWGVNLRYEQYTANNVNQYTQRTVPGPFDILGAASFNPTVTVNNRSSYRIGQYFRAEYPMANSTGALYRKRHP